MSRSATRRGAPLVLALLLSAACGSTVLLSSGTPAGGGSQGLDGAT
jgi:hypothetical protein